MSSNPSEVTGLFERAEAGDPGAREALLPLLYDELRGLAGRLMADERGGHTLQATALVHEAWMRLFAGGTPALNDREHLARLAARAMRRVLVDHARARRRTKRGGGTQRMELLDTLIEEVEGEGRLDILALHEALERFTSIDPLAARLIELRYFGGLSIAEAARALEVSTPTVERRWRVARLWLARELGGVPD
ncbi:MAG TPA: ECF-type sigma factor, partial [Planctomycetota bacterium]|nr:ECF-type sigma factor [Planctomycetota bacterium]